MGRDEPLPVSREVRRGFGEHDGLDSTNTPWAGDAMVLAILTTSIQPLL